MTRLVAAIRHVPELARELEAYGIACRDRDADVAIVRIACDGDVDAIREVACGDVPVMALVPRDCARACAVRAIAAIEAGAEALLPVDTPPDRLAAAIVELVGRGSVSDPFASEVLIRGLRARAVERARFAITTREREVLRLLVEGHTTADIAKALGIGAGTAQTHVKNLYRKLDVNSKAAATAIALRHHLV